MVRLNNRAPAPAWNSTQAHQNHNLALSQSGNGVLSQHRVQSATQDPNQQLFSAASEGDQAQISKCLSGGVHPDAADYAGWTALHWAVSANQESAAKLVLTHGANVNMADQHGDTALHWAAHFNNEPFCRMLLQAGASVHMKNDQGELPMHMSRVPMIQQLLNAVAQQQQLQPMVSAPVQQAGNQMSSFVGALKINATAKERARINGLAVRLDAERKARVESERRLVAISDVQAAVDDLRVQLVTAERSKKDSEQRLQELRPELERCKAAREDSERVLRDQRQRLEDSTRRLENATTNLQVAAGYAAQKREMEQALETETQNLIAVKRDLENTKHDHDRLRKEEGQKSASNRKLEQENKSKTNELNRMERNVNETLAQQMSREKEEFARLESEQRVRERELQELEAELNRWTDDSKRFRDDTEESDRKSNDKNYEVKNLNDKLHAVLKSNSELTSTKRKLEGEVKSLHSKLQNLQSSVQREEDEQYR